MSKSIIKLIDEAIVPALFLTLAKIAGLFATIYILNLPFVIVPKGFLAILPSLNFTNLQDYITAENYSNLAMFAAATLGASIVLIRAHFFHETHIHPKLHARLVSLNLENLIASSYNLYHKAAIWLIFLWLTCAFLFLSTAQGITYWQISALAFIITANFSWVLAIDVEKEVELSNS
jgi:hypothetical protein